MKKWALAIIIGLSVLVSTSAIDSTRIRFWEDELSPYMRTEDKALLQGYEKTLNEQLAAHTDVGLQAKLGITYHNLSRALQNQGVRGNAAKASALFQSILKSSAEEELKAVALAYLGSSLSLQGNEDSNPIAKISFVNQGMDKLNESVSKYAAVSWVPRVLRANVALSLPDFFHKLETGGTDLQSLEALAAKEPTRVPLEIQAMTENLLGNYWKKKNRIDLAVDAWKKAVALDPEKKASGKAAADSLEIYTD